MKDRQIMKPFNKLNEPINKITNQLSRLKHQLKQIKSMKILPSNQSKNRLYQNTNQKQDSIQKKLIKKRTPLNKSNSTFYEQTVKNKNYIQTQRRQLGQQLNMSLCKEVIKSHSNSKSSKKGISKDSRKGISKDSRKGISKDKYNVKDKQKLQNYNQQKTKSGSKSKQQIKKEQQSIVNQISQFDNIFADTKNLRKQHQLDKQIIQRKFQNQIAYSPNQVNSMRQRGLSYLGKQVLNQDISFSDEYFRKQIRPNVSTHKEKDKVFSLSLVQSSHRVKLIRNYEPKFIQINFHTSSTDNLCIQKSNNLYTLKSEMLLNSLKKSLLRYPNFTTIFSQSINLSIIPIQFQRFITSINQKSLQVLSERYVQYVRQIQCDINQIINLFNQSQNQKDSSLIRIKKSQVQRSIKKQSQKKRQKENALESINCQSNVKQNQEKQLFKKQLKQKKKQIKMLQTSLRQKQQKFTELQFRYILKCQQLRNGNKFKINISQNSPSSYIGNENKQIESHIQILQEQNTQLYQRIQLMKRQGMRKDDQIRNLAEKIQYLNKQITSSKKTRQLQKDDSKINQVKIQNLQQKVKQVFLLYQKQKNKYSNKLKQAETLNEQIKILKKQLAQKSKLFIRQGNQLRIVQKQINQFGIKQKGYQSTIDECKKANNKYAKNQLVLNKKIEQIIKQKLILLKQNTQVNRKAKQLSNQLIISKQRNFSLEGIQKQNQGQKIQNKKLTMKTRQLQKQASQLAQSIQLLKRQLQIQYERNGKLQESIQRYKDRCIKAEIQLKQQRYVEEQMNRIGRKQRQDQNTEEIRNIIKAHQDKLDVQD